MRIKEAPKRISCLNARTFWTSARSASLAAGILQNKACRVFGTSKGSEGCSDRCPTILPSHSGNLASGCGQEMIRSYPKKVVLKCRGPLCIDIFSLSSYILALMLLTPMQLFLSSKKSRNPSAAHRASHR